MNIKVAAFTLSEKSSNTNHTHLVHYSDIYDNLELRYYSQVISPAGRHIKLGKLLAAAL